MLAESQSADTVLLACISCQLGQVTGYRQGGSKQLQLLQHTCQPGHVASGQAPSRSHASAGSARGSGLLS